MEPDLTIVLLTFGCLFFMLLVILMSISAVRKRQYKKRQLTENGGVCERRVLLLGSRSAAIKAKRRLEKLIADLIEDKLCEQGNAKVLALPPCKLGELLSQTPYGDSQPQAFEMAFGALHKLSVTLKNFSSKTRREFQDATRHLALETSHLQKDVLRMLDPIWQRLQVSKAHMFYGFAVCSPS